LRLVEDSVNDDVGFDAGNCDGDLIRAAVVYDWGGGRELKRGKKNKNGRWD
jgi:hypothetical protein